MVLVIFYFYQFSKVGMLLVDEFRLSYFLFFLLCIGFRLCHNLVFTRLLEFALTVLMTPPGNHLLNCVEFIFYLLAFLFFNIMVKS